MSSSNPEEEIRQHLATVFGQAEYPVVDPMELIPVLPDGAATTFEATGVSLGAMEIGMGSSEYQGYPYDNVDTLGIDLYWVAVG